MRRGVTREPEKAAGSGCSRIAGGVPRLRQPRCANGSGPKRLGLEITTQHDQLADRVSRIALTLPKTEPLQDGKSVTTALIISCGGPFPNGATHPLLTILFTPLEHMFHVDAVTTRYRFDEGPIREYKLAISGRNKSYAVQLPKFADQDPIQVCVRRVANIFIRI